MGKILLINLICIMYIMYLINFKKYIDTEGSFMIERVTQIANSTINYIKENYPNCNVYKFKHIN